MLGREIRSLRLLVQGWANFVDMFWCGFYKNKREIARARAESIQKLREFRHWKINTEKHQMW